MRRRLFHILFAVLLAACAPVATQTEPPEMASATPIPREQTATPIAALTATPLHSESLNSATPAPTMQAAATSRGPNLEATDPQTVILASGGLQFVEFFEFWWTTCQNMAPMVHGLEAKYFGKVKFSYLEISNPLTADFQNDLGFRIRPSFYLLDGDGNILQEWIGYQTQDQFEEIFAQYVQ